MRTKINFTGITVADAFKAAFDANDSLASGIDRVSVLEWKRVHGCRIGCGFMGLT